MGLRLSGQSMALCDDLEGQDGVAGEEGDSRGR